VSSRFVVVFFPSARSIIDFILLCIAHNDYFSVKRALALFNQHRQFVAYPIHLIFHGSLLHLFLMMPKVEFRLRRKIRRRSSSYRKARCLTSRTRFVVICDRSFSDLKVARFTDAAWTSLHRCRWGNDCRRGKLLCRLPFSLLIRRWWGCLLLCWWRIDFG
jgi:hypothetical protein